MPPSLSELALAQGAVCLLRPLSPHATSDGGDVDGDGDDDGGDDLYITLMWRLSVICHISSLSIFSTLDDR